MRNPRYDLPPVGGLGKKIDASPPPEPEWKFHKPGFEINAKGQVRTAIPQNELAHFPNIEFAWPFITINYTEP